jgi:hypothetical protein
MDWPTFGASAITAVTVAFLGPRFQHIVWRSQRLREQRIAVAERLAKIGASLYVATHAAPAVTMTAPERAVETAELYLEQFSLLALVQVLFNDPGTLEAGTAFKRVLDEATPTGVSVEYRQKLHAYRVNLLSRLFAEAFGISVKKLERRAKRKNLTKA